MWEGAGIVGSDAGRGIGGTTNLVGRVGRARSWAVLATTRRRGEGEGEAKSTRGHEGKHGGDGECEGEDENEKGRGRGGDLWGRSGGNPRMMAAKIGRTDLGHLCKKVIEWLCSSLIQTARR